jgi:hypothetical protein
MEHLQLLLTRISEDTDTVWTVQRVQVLVGPEVSEEMCGRLLRRLERMRVLEPAEDGTWVRPSWSGGAQRDFYS